MVRVARYADNLGSSPRVRGKPRLSQGDIATARLIPARAGKTAVLRACTRALGAHPRACGENRVRIEGGDAGGGSSPRVRGKLYP